jgi:Protein of unknown function (DUF2742)
VSTDKARDYAGLIRPDRPSTDAVHCSGTGAESREVNATTVLRFLAPLLVCCPNRLIPGTPAWAELPDADPAKLRACLAATLWWALDAEHRQAAEIEASHDIAGAADGAAIGRYIRAHERFYREKSYLKRTLGA